MRRMTEPVTTVAHVAYDGPLLADGTMDVRDLAPALLALGDLLTHANRVLNDDKATIAVKIQADFARGSFGIGIALYQSVSAQLLALIQSDSVKSAKEIAEYVGLLSGGATGLFRLVKWLRSESPTTSATMLSNGNVEISVKGDNNTTIVHIVPEPVYRLASDKACREALQRVVHPLKTPGITVFQVRAGERVVEEVTTDDLPAFEVPDPTVQTLPEQPAHLLTVEIIKPSFEKDLTWTFSDGQTRFDATMSDPNYLQRVQAGEEFRIGDYLTVRMVAKQSMTVGGLRTRREVIEVVSVQKAPRQAQLLPTPRFTAPEPLAEPKSSRRRAPSKRSPRR